MPIKLVKPEGLQFHPPGSGWQFADGTAMHQQPDGCFYLPDTHSHYLDALIAKGWKVWTPPVPKPMYSDEFEREASERPLDVNSILKLAREEEVGLKAEGGKLRKLVVRGLSPRLAAHLKAQRIAVRSELERRQACRWSDV